MMFIHAMRALLLMISLLSLNSYALETDSTQIDDSCVRVVPNPTEAFEIRKDLIRAAKNEIQISYYVFSQTTKPYYLLQLLKEAGERGVKTRLILDHLNSKLPGSMLKFLNNMGVQIKYYNPIKLRRLNRFDRRMHDKYIIIDRELILVGGRNISDSYFIEGHNTPHTFYDVDALFKGLPAVDAAEYFDERWTSKWVEPSVQGKYDQAELRAIEAGTAEAARIMAQLEQKRPFYSDVLLNQTCSDAEFHHNHPLVLARNTPVEDVYVDEINKSTESIDFENAYILLTPKMKAAIKAAIKRKVKVRMIGNSLQSSDVSIQYAAYLNDRKEMLRTGIEIHEFLHPQTLHAKIAVFDNKRAIIGSFNLDPRSANINSETIVTTSDPMAVGPIAAFFDASLDLATEIRRNGKPVGFDIRHPGSPLKKRMAATIYRYSIAPLIRGRL